MSRLDIYVDAGSLKGNFSIGVLVKCKDIILLKKSLMISDNYCIDSINDAELLAIGEGLSLIDESCIESMDIAVYTDSLTALNAVLGKKYKNINMDVYDKVIYLKNIVTDKLSNRLYITKISSEDNHRFAHQLADDALSGFIYSKGEVSIDTINKASSSNPSAYVGISDEFMRASVMYEEIKQRLLLKEDTIRVLESKLDDINDNIKSLNEDNDTLATKNINLNDLKNHLIEQKDNIIEKINVANRIAFSKKKEIEYCEESISYLKNLFKEIEQENNLKIKFLKDDFESLTIKKYLRVMPNRKFIS